MVWSCFTVYSKRPTRFWQLYASNSQFFEIFNFTHIYDTIAISRILTKLHQKSSKSSLMVLLWCCSLRNPIKTTFLMLTGASELHKVTYYALTSSNKQWYYDVSCFIDDFKFHFLSLLEGLDTFKQRERVRCLEKHIILMN